MRTDSATGSVLESDEDIETYFALRDVNDYQLI